MTNRPTVLVTGAYGFIGRNVAKEYANQGYCVIGMGRGEWLDWRAYGISEWDQCDVTQQSLAKFGADPTILVHCAGGASVGYSLEHPGEDFKSTVQTTSHVLEYVRKVSPQTKLIYLSSAAVYGTIRSLPIFEDAFLAPVSPYGLHKQMAESLCQMYSGMFNLNITILRLFSIYGTGLDKQLLWDSCKKFSNGNNEFFGTGEEVRDWLHVNDLARLVYLISYTDFIDCPIVNVGSGIGVNVRDIVELISTKFKGMSGPEFSCSSKAGDPFAFIADISKAKKCGWKPEIGWQQGVTEYVEWYKSIQ